MTGQKIALVSGATRGLGRAVSLQLARERQHVIGLARTQGALTELADAIEEQTGARASLVPFDLFYGPEAFSTLGETLFNRFGRLDTLVLNAAMLTALSPLPHIQDKDWQKVLDVNVTANVRLLRVLDPMLRAAGTPQIVFVTCGSESMGHAFWGAYAASKKALEQLAVSYAAETRQAGFDVRLFDPGPMPTRLRREAFPGEDQSKLPAIPALSDVMLKRVV